VNLKQAQSIVGEFDGVSLGDKRLDKRLRLVAKAMESAPGKSLVEQAGTVAALEATYRFLSNRKVKPEAVLEGHAGKTAERAASHKSVLVVHDTTEFRFGGEKERNGLGRISTAKRDGFLAHYSICLATDGEPLGTLELYAWSRLDQNKRQKPTGTLRDPHRESLRWAAAVERASERLNGRTTPIHVMDREGDQFDLFATLVDNQQHFVVRIGHDRRLKKGRGSDGHARLHETLAAAPLRFTREVYLGRRGRGSLTNKYKVFPEREPRMARLEVRASTINLGRSHELAEHLPDSLLLNFVEARELDAPSGATPVTWRLVTTEPISSDAQIASIIDIYRQRWLIEEFFKALKTGCRFEAHQLEDAKGLLVALSIETAIAWQLLRLRYISRNCPEASAQDLLTKKQWDTLVRIRAGRRETSNNLTVQHIISELARLGVHLPSNGPPGWMVLERGLRKLNLLAEGLSLAQFADAPEDVINH
jgi:Transposase DNA-binding/Transposase DDE domain